MEIVLGDIICREGEKKSGFWKIDEYPVPVTIICGREEGKVVCVSAGVHNCEYTSIQAAIDLSEELRPEDIRGSLIILHTVNYTGFFKRVAEVIPEDNKNLNRVFPGNKEGTISERIAFHFSKYLYPKLDFFLDIHGGDLFEDVMPFIYAPGIGEEDVLKKSHETAAAMNLPYRVRSKSATGAYNSAAIQGVPSLLIERGGMGIWKKEAVENYKKNIKEVLSYLEILRTDGNFIKDETQIEINEAKYIDSDLDGYWYPSFNSGDKVKKNQIIGRIKNCFGKELYSYKAEFDGIVLYQTVSLAIPKGKPLIAYGKIGNN